MLRLWGAAFLVAGCSGFGFSMGAAQRREAKQLRQLKKALQEMEWELQYRMTQLPELCVMAADSAGGIIGDIFRQLGGKLQRQEVEDISGCVNALQSEKNLSRCVRNNLRQLGSSLGRYDLEGQLQGLAEVRQLCSKQILELEEHSAQRLRSYQTLAVCAGLALAIILI